MPLSLAATSEIASKVGALIGLPTLWQAFRARSIAAEVKERVDTVQANFAKQTAVEALGSLLSDLDEIGGLHGVSAWRMLPRRYGAVCRHLIAMRIENPMLATHSRKLQSIIQQLAEMEDAVSHSTFPASPSDIVALNKVLSRQMDKLNEILASVRKTIGGTTE